MARGQNSPFPMHRLTGPYKQFTLTRNCDMPNCSKILNFILFAADTNIFFSHNNLKTLIDIINMEMLNLSTWFRANRLSLNVSKTNFIIFGRKGEVFRANPLPVLIDGVEIKQTSNCKFLGVIIDEKLTWSHHIVQTSLKLSKNIGILNRLKHIVTKSVLVMLYNTLIMPYLSYCNIVWASTFKSHLTRLYHLQKRALRIITLSGYLTHTKPLFIKLNLLNVYDICRLQIGIFMYKYINASLPVTFNNYFSFNFEHHDHYTRNLTNFHLTGNRTALAMFSIVNTGPRFWNTLSPEIKSARTLNQFKVNLKKNLLSSYYV
jgi:hypothetical protein